MLDGGLMSDARGRPRERHASRNPTMNYWAHGGNRLFHLINSKPASHCPLDV